MASVVTASAAMIRSPSFSRRSSSVTITTSPRPMARMAFDDLGHRLSGLAVEGDQRLADRGEIGRLP